MADITPARKLFDLLISRDFDPEMLDASGRPASDPAETEIFSFDFRAQSGQDYGTVVIMLGDDNDLEIYCADNVGRSMEGDDKNDWFSFLEQLKNFAVRNFMSFGIKNLNRLRYSMQGQAAIKEGLFESWTGNRTTSWNGAATEARLMIRHKKNIAEGDARFRHIESLFIETADSERYKLPFKSLTAGRAMLEHVRQGGRPYDPRGNHISEMVTELNVLSRFRRANQGQIFEGDTQQLVEQVQEYQTNLQRSLKGLGTKTGYTTYFESWRPADISEQDVVIESLKNLFVKQSIDTRIESALPLLAKIQQQGTAMKEANIFEAWAERLVEGTWQTPDTPEKQAKLVELMSTDLPVGADATNVTEQLYDLLGDDELFDQLEALAEQDANADARQVIFDRMQMLSDNPDVLRVIEQLNIDPTAEMNPAEPTNPSDLEPVQEGDLEDCDSLGGDASDEFIRGVSVDQQDEVVSEDALRSIRRSAGLLTETELKENILTDDTGSTLQHIKDTFKRDIKDFETTGEISQHLHDALYDYYQDDMPYGVQKARDGDPYEWVADRFGADLGLPGYGMNSPGVPDEDSGLERESVMHGDYAEENSRMRKLAGMQDEGAEGTTGQIIKKLLDPLSQGLAGGGGKSLSIPLVGEEEIEEGPDTFKPGTDTKASYALQKGLETVPFAVDGAIGGAALGAIAGAALTGNPNIAAAGLGAGAVTGAQAGKKVADNAIYANDGSWRPTEEGWKGELAGGTVGTLAGGALGAFGGMPGSIVGGAIGGTAGKMIGDKLGGEETTEKQLNEVGPAIAIGARLLMPMLSRIGPALGRAAASAGKAGTDATGKAVAGVGRGTVELGKSAAQSAAKNAVPIGIGAGAYQAITDVATGLVGGVGEVYNDAGTAASALAKMVGNSLDQVTIEALASAAVKYAIPIGILIAVLYSGKKLIDKIFSESMEQDDLSLFDDATCNMSEAGESCPVHGVEECYGSDDASPLAGQYGHSGKMKAVDKDLSFLDRLKELSGMKK